ncbi:MAG TPA: hypothetical protein VFK97_03235 [Candidatus Saccharimonadales bacterium]|nr:hypothetical protein [Candidatus Saccharimonadales bacterium]
MNKGVVALALGFLLILSPAGLRPAAALTISGGHDCNDNAVIRCGIANSKDLAADFQDASVDHIYSHFGISQADINNFDSQAVAGSVTIHGAVVVNGKVVATNALTAGRQDMSGSKATTVDGTTFYVRPPSVSFQQPSLPAYVVMHNGRFDFAIIASCGNPVIATPKKPKVIIPPTTSTPPQPTPPVTKPPVTSLPNTGPGNILGVGGAISLVSGLGHFFYSRRKTA